MAWLIVALTPTSRYETTCFDRASALIEYQSYLAKGYLPYMKKISLRELDSRQEAEADTRAKYANV